MKSEVLLVTGHKTANGFVVHSGSIISNTLAHSIPSSLANKRKALIDEGVIVNDIFVADYQFNSASTSAGVVLGRSANGLIEWKDTNGLTLKSKMWYKPINYPYNEKNYNFIGDGGVGGCGTGADTWIYAVVQRARGVEH